jgi:hypothetical protein
MHFLAALRPRCKDTACTDQVLRRRTAIGVGKAKGAAILLSRSIAVSEKDQGA